MKSSIWSAWIASFLIYTTAGGFTIDVTTGTTGQFSPAQSFNETRGVDATVLTSADLLVSSMTLNGLSVGPDGTAQVGARIYSNPSGTLLAAHDSTIFASAPITLPISATLGSGQSYRICFFAGPLGPNEDNSATLFDPSPPGVGGFPYVESTGSFRIEQAYSLSADAYPTNQNFFVPEIDVEVNTATGVRGSGRAPSITLILPATPNPSFSSASVRFELSQSGPVTVRILDVSGRLIRRLADSAVLAPGRYTMEWDGTDEGGRRVASGIYWFNVGTGFTNLTSRLDLLR